MAGGKNKEFRKNPIAFMQKYACFPADLLENQQGRIEQQMDVNVSGNAKQYPLNKMESAYQIAYLDFVKRPRASAFNIQAPACADEMVGVSGTYTPTAGRVKSYFLPWVDGGIIKIEIPPLGFSAAHDDVNYFFTAGITGCSIFVRGTPQQPIVYHAGGSTGTGNDFNAGAKFWRRLIKRYEGNGFQEVNKTDYVSEQGLGGLNTTNSQAYEQWLNNNTPANLNINMTSPFGCVMGIRANNGDWTFYLQENATIIHTKMKKAHFYSKTRAIQTNTRGVARPMVFRQFFPAGAAVVNFVPGAVRVIT